jgi:hypothetical protein
VAGQPESIELDEVRLSAELSVAGVEPGLVRLEVRLTWERSGASSVITLERVLARQDVWLDEGREGGAQP